MCSEEKNYKIVNLCSYFNKKPVDKVKLCYQTRFGIINSEGEIDFMDFGPGTVVEILDCVYEERK